MATPSQSDITTQLRDLRDSIHECMIVYYNDDLPKMLSFSMIYHKKVIGFLKLMRVYKRPLTKVQKKMVSNILDVMNTAYNRERIYRDTSISGHEERGLYVLSEDMLALSSF